MIQYVNGQYMSLGGEFKLHSVKNNSLEKNFKLPSYTLAEEIMNALSHGTGAILSVIGFIWLLKHKNYSCFEMFCITVYCASLFILYAISTLYHAIKPGNLKAVFRKLDHCSIFVLIAGTYTPLCAICIKGLYSKFVLIGIWITAIGGVVLNAIDVNKFSKISLAFYIIMGWSVAFIAKPVFENLSQIQIFYLISGGIFYTIGAILYVIGKKIRYMHSVWHIFVLAGSLLHFFILC